MHATQHPALSVRLSISRSVGRLVGWLVGLSVSTQISKQAITLPNHIPACRSEFYLLLTEVIAHSPNNVGGSVSQVVVQTKYI